MPQQNSLLRIGTGQEHHQQQQPPKRRIMETCIAVVLLNELAFSSHMLYKSVTVSVFGIPTMTSSPKCPNNELQTEKKTLK